MSVNQLTNEILIAAVASHLDLPAQDLKLTRCSTGKYNSTFFLDGGAHPLVFRVAPEDERRLNLFLAALTTGVLDMIRLPLTLLKCPIHTKKL